MSKYDVASIAFEPEEMSKVLPPEQSGVKGSIKEDDVVQTIPVASDPNVIRMFEKAKANGIKDIKVTGRTQRSDEGR